MYSELKLDLFTRLKWMITKNMSLRLSCKYEAKASYLLQSLEDIEP